jgi:integrase/recombinase XerD
LIWDIAKFTGERWGAILKLRVCDVYDDKGHPRDEITFRACTRKRSPDGQQKTRQVPLHPQLRDSLDAYKASSKNIWLFPSPKENTPLTLRAADLALRRALALAGLESKGISTHSTRRTFITRLHSQGVDLYTLQKITGHQDLKALGRYVEISADRVLNAIAVL